VSLVNRIAAGEVIERPASVVKELVENALDAGAAQITVEIEDGGRELIRVTDDGCGIPPAELPLAFAEHATSKLTCDDDLFRIGSMGFRGEALASIGSVSHARLQSRTEGSESAWEIENRGGVLGDAQAASGNRGTTVEIRNLFYNTPARRKFMKAAGTESGHISEALLRLALPHPNVAFRLISGGRTTLDLRAGNAIDRLLAAWPEESAEQRLGVDLLDAEIAVQGLIGLPETAAVTAKNQYFYLNGRHIRDRFIQHALRESYRGLTEPGRQPLAILMITIPPADVDVNVHPTKAEVRFRDSGRIHGVILSGLRQVLLGSDLTPRARPMAPLAPMAPEIPHEQREQMRDRLAAFFRDRPPTVSSPPPMFASRDEMPAPEQFSTPVFSKLQEPQLSSPPIRSAAIQVHNSYLVAETEDGIQIIDQHALHERIMYEELRQKMSRGPLESQRMLIPDVIPCTQKQMAVLDQILPLLSRLGIEASAPAAWRSRRFPHSWAGCSRDDLSPTCWNAASRN
jgi:DNA mismatch repair protein MutL